VVPKISTLPPSAGGVAHRQLAGSPEELGGVAEDQHQRIGEQQLIELLAAVKMME
jgi:hypothetical protein